MSKNNTVIKKLLIDNEKMDDEKISTILDTIQEQDDLRCITIMNCSMGEKSVTILNNLLKKAYPNQIDELRFNNVRGIGDTCVE